MNDQQIETYCRSWLSNQDPDIYRKSDIPTEGYYFVSKDGKAAINLEAVLEDFLSAVVKSKNFPKNQIVLTSINQVIADMCREAYKNGEKITAVKVLLTEAKHHYHRFSITEAKEFLEREV
jgi:hypothetical protein